MGARRSAKQPPARSDGEANRVGKRAAKRVDPQRPAAHAMTTRVVRPATSNRLPTSLVREVRTILRAARGKAYAVAYFIMVEAYWRIGQRIVLEEQGGSVRADSGTFLIRNLVKALGGEFGHGLSLANLCNFRQFDLTFPNSEIFYTLRRALTWSRDRLVMRVENPEARAWYIHEAAQQGWSRRHVLELPHDSVPVMPRPSIRPSSTPGRR